MAQSKPRSALALTHSLDKAKARYPWAKAWVQVRGGFWCFESEQQAEAYRPASFHDLTVYPRPGVNGIKRRELRGDRPNGRPRPAPQSLFSPPPPPRPSTA